MWRALFSVIDQIPFIGKHKTITGAIGVVAGTILEQSGVPVGHAVREWSNGYMALGLADKGRKHMTSGQS